MRLFPSILGCLVLSIFLTRPGVAATLKVPCDFLSISDACMRARDGDLVLIQPGTCVISDKITIDRHVSFTIRGSGTNLTTLISGPGLKSVIEVDSDSPNVFTISDLNLVSSPNNVVGFLSFGNPGYYNIAPRPFPGPVHVYNIQMTNLCSRGITIGFGDSFGLVDHCFFDTALGHPGWQAINFGGNGFLSFTNPIPYGTTNAVYVEDCYFRNRYFTNAHTKGGNGFWDGYRGVQAVVRHSIIDGDANTGTHGYDSDMIGCRTRETYLNIFTNQTARSGLEIDLVRSGSLLVWSNSIYFNDTADLARAVYKSMKLQLYRGSCSEGFWPNPGAPGFLWFGGYNPVYCFTNIDGQNVQVSVYAHPGAPLYVRTNKLSDGGSIQFGLGYPCYMRNNISRGHDLVKVGKTLAETLSNIMLYINAHGTSPYSDNISSDSPGYGTAYSAGSHRNHDFRVVAITANSLTLQNIMDGTNAFGYPLAFQPGVVGMTPYTNTGVVMYPCYSWSNTVYGSNGLALGTLNFVNHYSLHKLCSSSINNSTNLLAEGRDYFQNTVAPGYVALAYPHPLQARGGAGVSSPAR